jgi:hypothetical protein
MFVENSQVHSKFAFQAFVFRYEDVQNYLEKISVKENEANDTKNRVELNGESDTSNQPTLSGRNTNK